MDGRSRNVKTRKVRIDRNSKCNDNLSWSFVARHDCTHAQSMRKNGNRAKWICRDEKAERVIARGRKRDRDERTDG